MKKDIAWLAGLIDGEGCLCARLTNTNRTVGSLDMRVTIQAASSRMIDAVQEIYDDIGVQYKRGVPRMQPRSTRPAHKIDVWRKASVEKLLVTLLPYLRVKDYEAKAIIAFFGQFPTSKNDKLSSVEDRQKIIETLRGLKKVA